MYITGMQVWVVEGALAVFISMFNFPLDPVSLFSTPCVDTPVSRLTPA